MNNQDPQWKKVLDMLQLNPTGVTTGDFCREGTLAAEYRRSISDLRRKGYVVKATREREGSFRYTLEGIPKN